MTDFILPDIGEGIVECELLKWHVAVGDLVKEDQAVAEVMTDKATVEIPSMYNGIVSKLYFNEGEIAKVHKPLFALEASDLVDHNKNTNNPMPNLENENSQKKNIESFVLPDIGEGIVECEIMQWHVIEGDDVKEDQIIVEVMTDKAIVEIPAKHDGRIVKLHYKKGDVAGVHTSLFDQVIGEQTNNVNVNASKVEQKNSTLNESSTSSFQSNAQRNQTSNDAVNNQGETFVAPIDIGRVIASPAVRRIAREHGISLAEITPSGAKGRVLKRDVLSSLRNYQDVQKQTESETTTHENKSKPLVKAVENKVESIKGIRAVMAKQMMDSKSTIPHFSVSDELCMDRLIQLRGSLKPVFEDKSIKLSFLPFFVKALSLAIESFPIINSRLNEDATELTYLGSHNIGIAVDSKMGLVVPNIKGVQNLSLIEVAKQINLTIEKAQQGRLTKMDMTEGTISISNIGTLGGISATPVINKPEVAIVALGKTQKLPRFNQKGDVVASNIMTLNWSGDHRVIDGATMVKFNNLWMEYLSNPERMLVKGLL